MSDILSDRCALQAAARTAAPQHWGLAIVHKRSCACCHLRSPLAQECRESPDSQLAPWGTMERLSPLLYTWAQASC